MVENVVTAEVKELGWKHYGFDIDLPLWELVACRFLLILREFNRMDVIAVKISFNLFF